MARKEEFYSEASILLGSGLDIKSCLSVIISEQTKKKQIEFFESISEKIINGKNLSDALQETKKISPFEYYTLKIGEETGRLADVLKQLSDHYNRQIKQKRQIINTFSYPAIVILTAILVVIFMMTFIVPLFEELFNRFHGELPSLTRFILRSSKFIASNIYFILLVLAGIVLSLLLVRKHPVYRRIVASVILKIPVLNSIVIKIYLSKFCQTMALLNSARIPIVTSIQLIRKIIGFYPFEKAFEQIEERIVNGGLLYEALREHSLFDPKIVSLTKVGEEVNQLNVIYQKLNEQYHDEVQHKITLLNSMLEPILIIFIGLFVAVILVSMYLPMFKMSSTMF
jgi:type IV pilus assembly protein PilC